VIIVITVIGKVKGHALLATVVFEDDLNKSNDHLFLTILLSMSLVRTLQVYSVFFAP